MAQFDVYRNPNPRSRRDYPWLVDLQHGLLDELGTRLVAPLIRPATLGRARITRLNPAFRVQGEEVVLLAQQLGAVRSATLGKPVATLAAARATIIGAVDVLISGL